jgi:cytidine deaminase
MKKASKVTEREIDNLFGVAEKSREHAYAAKTEHKIGASILTPESAYFGGCNIESNISGLGTCAERAAINHAIVNGKYVFKALMIIDKELLIPCGACLQYLSEFAAIGQRDITIISASLDGRIKQYSLRKLLPNAYFSKNTSKIEAYR